MPVRRMEMFVEALLAGGQKRSELLKQEPDLLKLLCGPLSVSVQGLWPELLEVA
ncbi:MAG: hypothetical protein V1764_06755 [Nitrospirota bacterium]